jgi:hypothetical protein
MTIKPILRTCFGTLMVVWVNACVDFGGDNLTKAWQGVRTVSGDTVEMRTGSGSVLGDLGVIPVESMDVTYAGEGLGRSTAISTAGTRLVVGEGTQIVVIDSAGGVDTIGRTGDGPGEFRRIVSVLALGDTIAVLDANANRLTRVSSTGSYTITTVQGPPGYGALRAPSLAACQNATLVLWARGMVIKGGPPDSVAAVWSRVGTPSKPWLLVQDISWTTGNIPGPRFPFGARALIASDGKCRVAYADGVTYAVQVRNAQDNSVSIYSIDETAPPVTAEERTVPEQWRNAWPAAFMPAMLGLITTQEYGDRRNKLEDIQFDAGGRLWLRVVDSTYQYHPFVMTRVAEARPNAYRWDVLDTDGRRLATLHLPSNFAPKAWAGRWVYGISEDESGAFVVGRLPVPRGLR